MLNDLRIAFRSLRKDWAFTSITILTLAIGVGANTAVFSVVHAILLEPLPYPEPDRLAMVWSEITSEGVREAPTGYANIVDWAVENTVFEGLATVDPVSLTLTGGEWPEQVPSALISANYFDVLGVSPQLGRTFTAEEVEARLPVAVVSFALWQRLFNGARDVIGRTVEVGDQSLEIVGVMPADFEADGNNFLALWLPQTLADGWDNLASARGTGSWRVIGRLAPGVTIERAQRDMDVIALRLAAVYPANEGLGVRVVSLRDQVTGQSLRLTLWTLFGAVGLVLLIACANAAHLILARGLAKAKDSAVRIALGASARRLLRQAIAESLLISLGAAVLGTLIGYVSLRLLVSFAPAGLPRASEIAMDGTVLAYALGISLAAGLVFGTPPALTYFRKGLYSLLRSGRDQVGGSGRYRARQLLIVVQFAMAIVLVFGANLLIRSFIQASTVDPGFSGENVILANLSNGSPNQVDFYGEVVREVGSIPGVEAAGIIEDIFIGGTPNGIVTVEGSAVVDPRREEIRSDAIAGDVFGAIGATLHEGRLFTPADESDTAVPVAIINETMARRFWPEGSPVGRRFRFGSGDSGGPWIEVVGVVQDMHRQGFEREPISQVFRPFAQNPSRNMNLLVRAEGDVPGLENTVRSRIAAIDRTVPLYGLTTLDIAMDRYLMQRRFQTLLLGTLSVVALALAALGIFGLIQFTVAQRKAEFGLRKALGAASESLVGLILRQGFLLAVPGVAAGLLGAIWLSKASSALLFEVTPTDLTSILVTIVVLLVVTFLACYWPARKAARIDPLIALR